MCDFKEVKLFVVFYISFSWGAFLSCLFCFFFFFNAIYKYDHTRKIGNKIR